MKSLATLALLLALVAVGQAITPQAGFAGVLLEGAVADETIPSGNVSVLGHGHRWHRWGPPHDHDDHHYWERRHSAKEELLRCLQYAVQGFDLNNQYTWRPAGIAAAQCLLDKLSHCHDAPGLPEDFRNTVPWIMFVAGLDALTDNGPTGLKHATTVMEFYLAGAYPTIPGTNPPQINPWYTESDSCASQLVSLLHSICMRSPDARYLLALAKTVVRVIEEALTAPGSSLAACAPDIPAVILALVSTSCPASGQLYNPLYNTYVPCVYNPLTQYEKSAGALLGGSVLSLLLLSGNPKLQGLGLQIGFAMNRMALAAAAGTTNFFSCISAAPFGSPTFPDYNGQLATTLNLKNPANPVNVPMFSGPFGPAFFQAATPLPLGKDGQRVLCAAIGMMSGLTNPANPANWNNNLLWQGTADITNAISQTILSNPTAITPIQVQILCAAGWADYTFTTKKFLNGAPQAPLNVALPGSPFLAPGTPQDWTCLINDQPTCPTAAFPFTLTRKPTLATGHTLEASSPAGKLRALYCPPVVG